MSRLVKIFYLTAMLLDAVGMERVFRKLLREQPRLAEQLSQKRLRRGFPSARPWPS